MKQISFAWLGLFLITLFLAKIKTTEGSLPPAFDSPGSLLSELWRDRFPDPFRVLEQIPLGFERDQSVALSPVRVDWKETQEEHVIRLDVPGMKKENRVVRVSGERKREEEKEGDHWHRVERSHGKFWRQFRMPDNVNLDSVKAKLDNGVLTININKLSSEKVKGPRVVDIAFEEDQSSKLSSA